MTSVNQAESRSIFRRQAEEMEALAFVDAELWGFAGKFKELSSQLENLAAHQPSTVKLALSKINMSRIYRLLDEHDEIERALRNSAYDIHRTHAK